MKKKIILNYGKKGGLGYEYFEYDLFLNRQLSLKRKEARM